MKKKLSDAERIANAAKEVLMDELRVCPGRMNKMQLETIRGMIYGYSNRVKKAAR